MADFSDGTNSGFNPGASRGVWGDSQTGLGVVGSSRSSYGVEGHSETSVGVFGSSTPGNTPDNVGVWGVALGNAAIGVKGEGGTGIVGVSGTGTGVHGQSGEQYGVAGDVGTSDPLFPDRKAGVWGQSDDGYGVAGTASRGNGLQGGSISGFGAVGTSSKSSGVVGISAADSGVYGRGNPGVSGEGATADAYGVTGSGIFGIAGYGSESDYSRGVWGESDADTGIGITGVGFGKLGYGVMGSGGDIGVFAENLSIAHHHVAYLATPGLAADFYGDIFVHGSMSSLGKSFEIDHPLNPEMEYLRHSSVESSERKTIYDGRIELDERGEGTVALPEWLDALNEEFRYQLTPIGFPCPELHVSREITGRSFGIAGGNPQATVCWQLTGVRKDPWAKANPFQVEVLKPEKERGSFLNPRLHDRSDAASVERVRYPDVDARTAMVRSHMEITSQKD